MRSEPAASGAISQLLERVRTGDRAALDQLFPLLYSELHAIASREMRGERENHTLQPTALVNEAYLKLVGGNGTPAWRDRAHFLSAAARAMKNVLVDHARAYKAQKRDGGLRVTLTDSNAKSDDPGVTLDLLALDDALTRLGEAEPRWAQVVELRFFGGLEIEEAAEALQVSPITVSRDWRFAKAWLADKLVPSA
jgi:RNA polymerase sigma factor (TIGR02999 family)